MAKRISIREYQAALSERLRSAAVTASTATVLGVAIGENRWLVHMNDVSEVLPLPELAPVPLTRPWFRGVANVRGNLYGITDLAAFLGGARTPPGLETRILLASPRLGVNSGLLVKRMLGIRNLADFKRMDDDAPQSRPGSAGFYQDGEGQRWLELNLRDLLRDETFLQIAA